MILLIAAAIATAEPPVLRQAGAPSLMAIYGVSTDDKGVTVSLRPLGCNTLKSDFTVAVTKSADRPTILFARKRATNDLVVCKAQPREVALTWTYDDLGLKAGQPFSLANPLVMAP